MNRHMGLMQQAACILEIPLEYALHPVAMVNHRVLRGSVPCSDRSPIAHDFVTDGEAEILGRGHDGLEDVMVRGGTYLITRHSSMSGDREFSTIQDIMVTKDARGVGVVETVLAFAYNEPVTTAFLDAYFDRGKAWYWITTYYPHLSGPLPGTVRTLIRRHGESLVDVRLRGQSSQFNARQ